MNFNNLADPSKADENFKAAAAACVQKPQQPKTSGKDYELGETTLKNGATIPFLFNKIGSHVCGYCLAVYPSAVLFANHPCFKAEKQLCVTCASELTEAHVNSRRCYSSKPNVIYYTDGIERYYGAGAIPINKKLFTGVHASLAAIKALKKEQTQHLFNPMTFAMNMLQAGERQNTDEHTSIAVYMRRFCDLWQANGLRIIPCHAHYADAVAEYNMSPYHFFLYLAVKVGEREKIVPKRRDVCFCGASCNTFDTFKDALLVYTLLRRYSEPVKENQLCVTYKPYAEEMLEITQQLVARDFHYYTYAYCPEEKKIEIQKALADKDGNYAVTKSIGGTKSVVRCTTCNKVERLCSSVHRWPTKFTGSEQCASRFLLRYDSELVHDFSKPEDTWWSILGFLPMASEMEEGDGYTSA